MRLTQFSFLFVAMALMLAGCGNDGPDVDVESAIPVRIEQVTKQPMRAYAFATGTVLAANDATLTALQSGYYRPQTNPRTGKPFAMGDKVKQGEAIVVFLNPEFEYSVAFDSKKLNYEMSQSEFEKQKSIYDKGGITLRELTDAERTAIDARYAYDNATIQLAKLKIVAPFDGFIVDLPYFSKNQLVEAGSLIAQVMDYSTLHSDITLPGSEMGQVKPDQQALITNYNKPDDTLIGRVTQVSPALDPDSRMFKVALEVANDDLLLRAGMFVKIDIIVEEKDSTLVIPKDIILDNRGNKQVFVVQKGVAAERTLETGLSNRTDIEVIGGLEENDQLVVEGFETLRDRSRVKVVK